MTLLAQLRYIIFETSFSSFYQKMIYLLEKIYKLIVIIINNIFNKNIKLPYLIRKDYILRNKNGIWNIQNKSDFDFIVNPYFEIELEKYFKCNDGIFLDIGAHVGKWSIFVAKNSKNCNVFSFEPNKNTKKYLDLNILTNSISNIKTFEYGISNERGIVSFENNDISAISKISENFIEGSEINVISIDQFIDENNVDKSKIKLIKIDTEGHEFKVFSGMKNLLKYANDELKIICEILPNQSDKEMIFGYMKDFGFSHSLLESGFDYMFFKAVQGKN